MKKVEKDVLVLMLGISFLKSTYKKIEDYVVDYDEAKFLELEQTKSFLTSEEKLEKVFSELLNDAYKRLKEKFWR